MKSQLIPKPLDRENFRPFGSYANLLRPSGERLGEAPVEFFRDLLQQDLGACSTVSFSTCLVGPRDLRIDVLECHARTAETMMPLDNDVLVQVAPATAAGVDPDLAKVQVFLVPRGTMFLLRPGVWHHGPFAADNRAASLLVALPERTYANDTTTVEYPADQQLRIQAAPVSSD